MPSRQQAARAGQGWVLPGSAGAEAVAQERERQRWQGSGVAVLLSGGEDARILTYPTSAFMAYHPFCICPAPQLPVCEASRTAPALSPAAGAPGASLSQKKAHLGAASRILLLQQALSVDLWCASAPGTQARRGPAMPPNGKGEEGHGGPAAERRRQCRRQGEGVRVEATERVEEGLVRLAARVRTAGPSHIVCSSISSDGSAFALSDSQGTRLYSLERVALAAVGAPDSGGRKKRFKGTAPAEARAERLTEDGAAEAEGATEWRVHRLRWQVGAADAAVLAREGSPSTAAAAERGRTDVRPSSGQLSSALLPSATRLAFLSPPQTCQPSPHRGHKRGLPNGSAPVGDSTRICLALASTGGNVLVSRTLVHRTRSGELSTSLLACFWHCGRAMPPAGRVLWLLLPEFDGHDFQCSPCSSCAMMRFTRGLCGLALCAWWLQVLEVGYEGGGAPGPGTDPQAQASSHQGKQRWTRLLHSWRPFAGVPRATPITHLCSHGRWLVAACAGGMAAVYDLERGRWVLGRLGLLCTWGAELLFQVDAWACHVDAWTCFPLHCWGGRETGRPVREGQSMMRREAETSHEETKQTNTKNFDPEAGPLK